MAVLNFLRYSLLSVYGLTTWTSNAKLMRAQALSLRERTFIKAQTTLGKVEQEF